MAQPTVVRDLNNDLWARAATGLSDNDKRNINFNRPDHLNILAELHETAEKSRGKSVESRWKYTRKNGEVVIIRDVLEKIARWIDMFKQVGDVAVQYDPTHASLPWAAVRFLLQIAVNDINKYASVVEDLARIAELICRFALIEELYLQGTSKAVKELEKSIIKLYAHILTFLSTAKQYLEQGTVKRTLKSALLTEKDLGSGLNEIQAVEKYVDRCVVLVDRMDNTRNHTKLMDILARIDMPLRRMDNGLNKIQDDLQVSKRTKILQWLSPEPYIQHHKQTMQGVLTGTGQWLLSDPVFKKWKDDSASSILWLHGIPGSGKSKLVSVVVEDALARYKAGDSPQPVFFYCSRNPAEPARSEPQAILASLARQLSCVEPGKALLGPSVNLYREKEAEGFASGSLRMDESLKLVLQLITQYPLTTIVLDAMDECNLDKRHELLKALEKILRNSSSLVKIFVSSRNDQDIVLRLRHYPNLEINSQRNSDDIARFVKDQTQQLIQDEMLLQYSNSKTEMKKLIIGKVIEGAAGMFRWASMQLQYLCSFELDDDIKSSLGRLPPDLNKLYDEIHSLLSTKPGQVQAAVFRNALRWLLCARRRLTTEEFLCAISIDSKSGRTVEVVSKDLVLKICNNFVVFDPQLDTFRFAHLSVREYLEQRPEYGNSISNALAAEVCLWTVLFAGFNSATKKLLLELGWQENASLAILGPLCTYADNHWPVHCKLAKEQRGAGKLRKIMQHALTGLHGADSAIAMWNNRLHNHWASYPYGSVRMALEDTFPMADTETSIGLLVSCAFDFEEWIGVEVAGSTEMLQCVNRHGRSLLHVAARNGNCASIAKLLTMDQHRREVTPDVVVAAARNRNNGKEVMALLLDRRGDDIQITQDVVVAAARNRNNGKEVMALLLDRRGDDIRITQDVVVAAAENYNNGKEVMALLLDRRGDEIQITQDAVMSIAKKFDKDVMALLLDRRGNEIQITHGVVVAAAENRNSGKEVMTLLLNRRGNEIQITHDVVVAAAGNSKNGEDILTLLLDWRGDEIQISLEVMIAAAGNYNGQEILALLLSQRGDEIQITQDVVVAAAGNSKNGEDILTFLLDWRGDEIQISPEVMIAAARNDNGKEILALLLSQRGDEIQITQDVVVAAARNDNGKEILALLLSQRGDEIQITQDVVVTAARNDNGKEILALLLSQRGDEIQITQDVVVTAAKNYNGKEILTLLFDRWGADVQITQDVVVAAAKNYNGKEILTLLFDRWGADVQITQDVVVAAAKNYNGKEILTLLFDRWGADVQITEEVIIAIIDNKSKDILTLLFNQWGADSQIMEEVVIAAARNDNGKEILTLLFDRWGADVQITEEVVIATIKNYKSSEQIMALLLDQREADIPITANVLRAIVENRNDGEYLWALLSEYKYNEMVEKLTEIDGYKDRVQVLTASLSRIRFSNGWTYIKRSSIYL